METVTINGEERRIGEFKAYKATCAMDIIAGLQANADEVLAQVADFKRSFEHHNYTEFPRAEARRQFGPRVLYRDVIARDPETDEPVKDDEGQVVVLTEPALDAAGQPVLGPDDLVNVTEADWEKSNQVLRVSTPPNEGLEQLAMIPLALKVAKAETLRILALVLATNADLQRWDTAEDVDVFEELDKAGQALLHEAYEAELFALAATAVRIVKAELADPFQQLREEVSKAWETVGAEPTDEPAIEPMQLETEAPPPETPDGATTTSPGSSTSSPPADTDGDGQTSLTASRSAVLSSSGVA